jgi:signal transduction histidine kinase
LEWSKALELTIRKESLSDAVSCGARAATCSLIVNPGLSVLARLILDDAQAGKVRPNIVILDRKQELDIDEAQAQRELQHRAWVTRVSWPGEADLLAAVVGRYRRDSESLSLAGHEMATPLAAISGWCELLLKTRGPIDIAFTKRVATIVLRCASHLERLVGDLSAAGEGADDRMSVELAPVDFASITLTAVSSLGILAKQKRVALSLTKDEPNAVVMGDEARLLQVLVNLITNSIKFTPEGGRIELSLARSKTHIDLVVQDTGIGISSSELPLVFRRLTRGRKLGGRGLGLSIARDIDERHGGSLSAHSSGPNRGATFRLRLELAREAKPVRCC